MQLKLKSFFNAMAFCMSLAWKTSKHYTIGRCTLLILSTCTPYISMFLNKILIDSLTIINEKNYFTLVLDDDLDIFFSLLRLYKNYEAEVEAYEQTITQGMLLKVLETYYS